MADQELDALLSQLNSTSQPRPAAATAHPAPTPAAAHVHVATKSAHAPSPSLAKHERSAEIDAAAIQPGVDDVDAILANMNFDSNSSAEVAVRPHLHSEILVHAVFLKVFTAVSPEQTCKGGEVIEVVLDKPADVLLLSEPQYQAWRRGQKTQAIGGPTTASLVR